MKMKKSEKANASERRAFPLLGALGTIRSKVTGMALIGCQAKH